MSTWSMASEGSGGPVYTPTTSIIDLINDSNSIVLTSPNYDQNSSVHAFDLAVSSENDAPDTPLAIFRYELTTLSRTTHSNAITLNDHPLSWPGNVTFDDKMAIDEGCVPPPNLRQHVRTVADDCASPSIVAMSFDDNCAAKLLIVIFWSSVMRDEQKDNFHRAIFWETIGDCAIEMLFDFCSAPAQYIGWVQNVKGKNKGSLEGVVSDDGEKFFIVTEDAGLDWLSDLDGLERAKRVIREPLTLKLEVI